MRRDTFFFAAAGVFALAGVLDVVFAVLAIAGYVRFATQAVLLSRGLIGFAAAVIAVNAVCLVFGIWMLVRYRFRLHK
jgi:hypothetical protein